MGRGCGPVNSQQLSERRFKLAATSLKNKRYALFGGGFGGVYPSFNDVDIFDANNNLDSITPLELSEGCQDLVATTINSGSKSYALFGGGWDGSPPPLVGDLTVFRADENGNITKIILEKVIFGKGNVWNDSGELESGMSYLAATSVKTKTNKEYALFGGGGDATLFEATDRVIIFDCNDTDVSKLGYTLALSNSRGKLAATTIRSENKTYALFGGGQAGTVEGGAAQNIVDVFECNDAGVFFKEALSFNGDARYNLEAITIRSENGKEYALFGGGNVNDDNYSNDVDVFTCNDTGVFNFSVLNQTFTTYEIGGATTINCDNKEYGLLGGSDTTVAFSSGVDVFECTDTEVTFKKTIMFEGLDKIELAATTVNSGDCEIALFAGGRDFNGNYLNDVEMIRCEDII